MGDDGTPGVAVREPADLSAPWLTAVLQQASVIPRVARISDFSTVAIGTGQMSESHRVHLHYADACDGPDSVVLKVAASDPASRATGVGLGAYAREVRFYRNIAAGLGGPVPACHHADGERHTGWFTLLLEDLFPARPGDELAGATVEQAGAAIDALAAIQAAAWEDPQLADVSWLNASSPLNQALLTELLPGFAERYGDRVAPEHFELAERFVGRIDAWASDRRGASALQHGDFRLDNLLFANAPGQRPVVAVDWQTVFYGPAQYDLAYFLGCSLPIEQRRRHGEALVRRYHDGLVAAGVEHCSLEECFGQYRRMAFGGLVMSIAASMLVERTERGDDMFMAVFARHAQQAIDLESLRLLPPEPAATRAPLRPEPADEGRHDPGEEDLWNESWYFDFTTGEHGLAGYTRLGLYPNRDEAWITLALCRPGGPTVRIVDLAARLPPGEELHVRADASALVADHVCEEPLRRFSVAIEGIGESFADPAAILRGESGTPTPIALALTWVTDGDPYRYRPTTRYEIPCLVSGRVSIDGHTTVIDGHGQRDHSWGTRDWWAFDWMWSSARLEDGTRLQATEVRLPGRSVVMGYLQSPGRALHELSGGRGTETTAPDGLVTAGEIDLPSAELELEVTPLADGPLLLVADDGRTSFFLRSCCRVRAGDGRRGLGWVEWNHNQRPG